MTSYAQQVWQDNVTPVDSAHMTHIEQGIGGALAIPSYGTSLPASPVDGQRAVLVDSTTNPSYQWEFRYNAGSTSAYKWEFVGGSPARADVATSESTTASPWVDLATPQRITVPRAGDYRIQYGCTGGCTSKGSALQVASTVGGLMQITAPDVNYGASMSIDVIVAAIAASTVTSLQFGVTFGGTASFSQRYYHITPVRVS
jgi:hypothetical protein